MNKRRATGTRIDLARSADMPYSGGSTSCVSGWPRLRLRLRLGTAIAILAALLALPLPIHAQGPILTVEPASGLPGDSFVMNYELDLATCLLKGDLFVQFDWLDTAAPESVSLDTQPVVECHATGIATVPINAIPSSYEIQAVVARNLTGPVEGTEAFAKFDVLQKSPPTQEPTPSPRRTRRPPRPQPSVAIATLAPVTTSAPQTTAPQTTAPQTTAPQTTAPQTTAPQTTAPEATSGGVTAPTPSPDATPRSELNATATPATVIVIVPTNAGSDSPVLPAIALLIALLIVGLITTGLVLRKRSGPRDPGPPMPRDGGYNPTPPGPPDAQPPVGYTPVGPPTGTPVGTPLGGTPFIVPPIANGPVPITPIPPLNGGPPSSPPFAPPPIPPIVPLRIPRDPNREPSRSGCDFAPASWTADGDAFQAIAGDSIPAESVQITGKSLVPIGGDYWHVPYRRGNEQSNWFGTPIGSDRDSAVGTFYSREFEINFNSLSFLVAGDQDEQRLRVELLLRRPPAIPGAPMTNLIELPWTGYTGRNSRPIARRPATAMIVSGRWCGTSPRCVAELECFASWMKSTEGHIDLGDPNCSMEPPAKFVAPIWGWADIHAHPMANWGFGGRMIWGSAGGAIEDLGHCEPVHGLLGTGLGANNLFTAMLPEGGGIGHLSGGSPEFDGFPRHTNTVHQTMHWDWVRRAFDGGLRLLVALAVNTELLAREFSTGSAIESDDASMRAQITNWSSTIPPWAEIALDPAHARRIIGEDRLAIVLGLEVDRALALWAKESDLPTDPVSVRTQVQNRLNNLRQLGIRQLNPNSPDQQCLRRRRGLPGALQRQQQIRQRRLLQGGTAAGRGGAGADPLPSRRVSPTRRGTGHLLRLLLAARARRGDGASNDGQLLPAAWQHPRPSRSAGWHLSTSGLFAHWRHWPPQCPRLDRCRSKSPWMKCASSG